MKLIPTPQVYRFSDNVSSICGFANIVCKAAQDATIVWALQKLKEAAGGSGAEILTIQNGDDPFFEEKNAAEQGYILIRDADGITLTAQSSVGILYGLMTLCQLCPEAPETFEIYDRPQIRIRGNMNTLWAETGVWSYDFGDGIDAAQRRLEIALDDAARLKLNMMYIDAAGYGTERFPGYDKLMSHLADYARVRGVRLMFCGYGMGYAPAHHNNSYYGTVHRNRRSYPDGEIYDCIGTYDPPITEIKGRSFGTCLSNQALTREKTEEIRRYLRATGTRMIYMHNMDADQIHEPLWECRCEQCRKEYPSESLYEKDGAAGAFAAFYDQMLDALLPEFPDLIICPVSPGYAYAVYSDDAVFEKCRKFWSAIYKYCRNKKALVPLFRELFYQHESKQLRFELIHDTLPSFGCVYFSSSDGFYSDKIYTPSAAYTAMMRDADVMICANGSALQKPTQAANAEYLWNTDNSAFYNLEFLGSYPEQMAHYNNFREGKIRPAGIYGEDGLLETSCALLFGKEHAKRIADVFRLQGKNGECPIFTACNVELWTNYTKVNYPMLWDTPVGVDQQKMFRERFSECAMVTQAAQNILEEILGADDLSGDAREHLAFLLKSAKMGAKLCNQLTRYMDLYMEADRYLSFNTYAPLSGDLVDRCEALIKDANRVIDDLNKENCQTFDPKEGILLRRTEMFEFVAYCAGQIIKSLQTKKRVPDDRKPLRVRNWW